MAYALDTLYGASWETSKRIGSIDEITNYHCQVAC